MGSADISNITLDSVRDHTMSQQPVLDTTLSSSTSKSSVKDPKANVIKEEPEAEKKEETTTDVVANGAPEDVNGVIETLESTVISDHDQSLDNPPVLDQKSEPDNDDTIIDEDTAEKTADITEEQNETTVLESTDKTIELHESENSTNEDEKVTCVDEPNTKNVVDVADDDNGVDGAPLA